MLVPFCLASRNYRLLINAPERLIKIFVGTIPLSLICQKFIKSSESKDYNDADELIPCVCVLVNEKFIKRVDIFWVVI